MKNISKIIISSMAVLAVVSVCTACNDNKAQTRTETSITQNSTESSPESSVQSVPSDVQSSENVSSEGMTDKEIEDMSKVDDRIQKLMSGEDFKAASEQNKLEAVETLLNELAKEDLIIAESIYYDVDNKQFSFQYKSGALGGVMMKDFDERMN
ncbi:MAG: hypothetical protein PUG48_09920 [Clostridia bacterium]|nr:hypothetical protein [Clostridia bacterium]